jgi:hypothetical protein
MYLAPYVLVLPPSQNNILLKKRLQCTTKSSITGPQWLDDDVYTKEDQVGTTATIWAPCGVTGLLNVNNRIALTATNSTLTGELSDDGATVGFTHQVHVSWRVCTP